MVKVSPARLKFQVYRTILYRKECLLNSQLPTKFIGKVIIISIRPLLLLPSRPETVAADG